MRAKRTTISDIAKRAGYSKTAVSFAFNCPDRISDEAREKILQVAKELDYYPDPMARNFSLGRHMTIGFLLPQMVEITLSNPYIQQVIMGIGEVSEREGYTLTLIPPLRSSINEALINAPVDGLIAMGINFDENLNETLRRRKLPVVVIDSTGGEDVISLRVDDVSASQMQMERALSLGHRDIAVISLLDDAYSNGCESSDTIVQRRKRGYENALREYGMSLSDIAIYSSDTSLRAGKESAKEILRSQRPSCILCMSDIVAIGVLSELKEERIKCPEEISVIGFDGIIPDGLMEKSLTTIVQSALEKGRKSAELLFGEMRGEKTQMANTIPFYFKDGDTLREANQNTRGEK